MNTILVPVGYDKKAVNTLQYAIDFAEIANAKIYVINVFGVTKVAGAIKKIDNILEQDSHQGLQEILKNVESKDVEIITKSIKGSIKDVIERVAKQLEADLIITSTKSDFASTKVFLGRIGGRLIKSTEVPILFVPRKYKFKGVSEILMAVKSTAISSPKVISPLKNILNVFDANLNLIRVETPDAAQEDSILSEDLKVLHNNFVTSENATVFQGVLEHLHALQPDMICVVRRKKGFFKRLWEKDRVYKKDFETKIPLLVLKGME